MTLRSFTIVSEHEAFALAGPDAWMAPMRDLAYAQGSGGCVIVADPADDLERSGVWTADTFRVLGPVPNAVRSVWMRASQDRPLLHVFVRLDGGCLYLGTASPCAFSYPPASWLDFELTECVLRLREPVPAGILDQVRPPSVPADVPGVSWIDRLADDRFAALREFLTSWYPNLEREERPLVLTAMPNWLFSKFRDVFADNERGRTARRTLVTITIMCQCE